jgi:hypothetical protein
MCFLPKNKIKCMKENNRVFKKRVSKKGVSKKSLKCTKMENQTANRIYLRSLVLEHKVKSFF